MKRPHWNDPEFRPSEGDIVKARFTAPQKLKPEQLAWLGASVTFKRGVPEQGPEVGHVVDVTVQGRNVSLTIYQPGQGFVKRHVQEVERTDVAPAGLAAQLFDSLPTSERWKANRKPRKTAVKREAKHKSVKGASRCGERWPESGAVPVGCASYKGHLGPHILWDDEKEVVTDSWG